MGNETPPIQVTQDTDLGLLLDSLDRTPVLLTRKGRVYRLVEEPVDDIWAHYDPKQARAAMRRGIGALEGINREALLAEIHAAREQDSAGRHD